MADTAQRDPNFIPGLLVQASTGVKTDGPVALWADKTTHRLLVDAGTITTSSASVGSTGAAVPASADYIGFNVGGNLTGISVANPLPVTGTFTNPSTGAAVPATANYIAGNNGGNLTGLLIGQQTMANSLAIVLASNQTSIPVAATLTAETTKVIGTINIAASQTVGLVAGAAIIGKVATDQTTHGTTDLVAADITKVGGTSFAIGQQLASASLPIVLTAAQITTLTPPAAITGFALESGGNLAIIAGNVVSQGTALGTIKVSLAGGSVTTNAPTFTTGQINQLSLTPAGGLRIDLKDSASNTNNFNVAVAAALPAGTALVGKVGIDQTTPGTTNAIAIAQINAATTLAGNGATGTGSLRVTPANDSTGIANWGHGATAATAPTGATYGGRLAKTALPSAVTDGQMVGAMADKFGRQVVLLNGMRDIVLPMTQLTLTSTTTETSLITAVASTFLDLLSIVVINTSATATQVDFRDSTAGTIRLSLYVPAGDTRGIVFNTPLTQAAVNTAWTAKCATSVASVIITGSYVTNK